eukprot:1127476-Amphidinium_carterae.1
MQDNERSGKSSDVYCYIFEGVRQSVVWHPFVRCCKAASVAVISRGGGETSKCPIPETCCFTS